jgi:hypothetical protein
MGLELNGEHQDEIGRPSKRPHSNGSYRRDGVDWILLALERLL